MKSFPVLVLFLLTAVLTHAQTCSSGLGDPIVNITFGAGTGFGPPLAAGITNMQYVASECVGDNVYTITNQVANCYVNDWLTINKDHTGDPNGYFMMIGASFEPSTFYVQTVSGLCGSTSYQFAAWVLNMASHAGEGLPDITFSIEKVDGTVLQSFDTGNVPFANPAQWDQYSFIFTTPPGVTSVVLRMTNNAPGGYGNDLCLDDITFRTAGPSVDVAVTGHTSDTVTICPGNNLEFLSQVKSCYSSSDYQWQESTDNGGSWTSIPGAVSSSYSTPMPIAGNYLYRLAVAQTGNIGLTSCEVVSSPDSIVVLGVSDPAVAITGVTTICVGTPVTFTARTTGGGISPQYEWTVNGTPTGSTNASYTDYAPADGDQISCMLTSNAACVADPVAASNILSLTVTKVGSSVGIVASANSICSDSAVTFTATPVNGGNSPFYQWLINGQAIGDSTSLFRSKDLNDGDMISVVMTSDEACTAPTSSNIITMTVYETPAISLTPDTVIKAHSSIRLSPVVTGPVQSYQWSPANGLNNFNSPDPVASPTGTTIYDLEVISPNGCTATAKERVQVFYDLLMPNAFTPNGDGINDLFRVPAITPVIIEKFSVFNRWGGLVFTGTGADGWDGRLDGKPQAAGTYMWMVEYYDPITKASVMKKGTVELIR